MKTVLPSRTQTALVLLALAACGAWAQPAAESGPGPRVIRGNDQVIAPPPAAAALPQGPATNFRFEDAAVRDVIHVVLGDLLKVNFVAHTPLEGRLTIVTQTPVSNDEALALLETALQAIGLAIGRDTRGTYHVGRPEVIRGLVPAVRQASQNPLPPGTGAIVVPLRYIGATEMAAILRPMAPPDAIARVDTLRNLLVLIGTRGQAEGWLSLIETFDVNLLKGMSVGFFPLRYAAVAEIESALQLMSGAGAAVAPAATATAPRAGSPGSLSAPSAAAAAERQPLYGAIRVLPMERLNAVLVVSPRAEYIDEARRLIERMDRPSNNMSDARLFVYPVRNGTAGDLAEVLNGIFGGGPAAATPGATGVAPGLTQTTGTTARSGVGGATNLAAPAPGGNAVSAAPAGGVSTVQINNNLRVVADPRKNALLIYASPFQFERIEEALKRLDVPPVQVLIEASIVEVTLTDDMTYGLQWLFTDQQSNGKTGTAVLSNLDGGVVGGPVAGFSYTLRNAMGNIRAVLNALAEKSLVRVISTPSLMVLDNHTASIVVGNQQPIRSTETVTDGGTRSTSIQYKDTGVALAVTPSVNAGEMVTMHVNQAVTDVGAVDLATGQRSFLQRQIASRVAVKAGETLVLGGLIRDNNTDGSNGVPGLHEVPLFGALFGTKSRNTTRTELLVIITPRVVRSTEDAREVSREMRERMQGLQPLQAPAPAAPPVVAPGGPHS
jgi:general secretion pathway protein D